MRREGRLSGNLPIESKSEADTDSMRSTTMENEPKVETQHIDLLKLYNRVIAEGGYDLVSDTKKKPLMWRSSKM
jgi:hypothetical protein